jgi:cyclopropane-fatty-acyl-phospholipid synthase
MSLQDLIRAKSFPPYLVFKGFVRKGTLQVIDADGHTHIFGGTPGPKVTLKLHDKSLYWRIFYNPQLYIAEAFVDGIMTLEQSTLDDFLLLMAINNESVKSFFAAKWRSRLRHLLQIVWQNNALGKATENIAYHYDISNELYSLFLDQDMQYSCAYFRHENDTLEQAQINKKNHIIAKLKLEPGQRVLDIGCGWGGLAISMAKQKGVHVTGVTLSKQQFELATRRVQAEGLSHLVTIKLMDYRLLDEQFDRIVSVGMFEHVGLPHYKEYFDKVKALLTDDGFMLLHSIGYVKPSLATHPWLEKYMFRNGYLPALSECIPSIEQAGFFIADVEVLRLHYSYTLREWKKRLRSNADKIRSMYDDAFFRMFDLYLAGCEISMIHCGTMAFQVLFSKKIDAIPLTRDFIYDADAGESGQRQAMVS